MTTPYERTRALVFAYETLQEVESSEDVPADLRRAATVALRHFPTPAETTQYLSLCLSVLSWFGPLSEDPSRPGQVR